MGQQSKTISLSIERKEDPTASKREKLAALPEQLSTADLGQLCDCNRCAPMTFGCCGLINLHINLHIGDDGLFTKRSAPKISKNE